MDIKEKKRVKILEKSEIEELIIDVTEQSIERPVKNEREYYSGKKKRHTIKTQIVINKKGKIMSVSKSFGGSVHDFKIYKEESKKIDPKIKIYADSGYQGIGKIHKNSEIPIKSYKKNPLSTEDKAYNKALSSVRTKVENVIRQIKIFKILSNKYRKVKITILNLILHQD